MDSMQLYGCCLHIVKRIKGAAHKTLTLTIRVNEHRKKDKTGVKGTNYKKKQQKTGRSLRGWVNFSDHKSQRNLVVMTQRNLVVMTQRNLVVMTCGLSNGLAESLRSVARGTFVQSKNEYSITDLRRVRACTASSSLLYVRLKHTNNTLRTRTP